MSTSQEKTPSFLKFVRDLWLIIGITLLFLILIELICSAIVYGVRLRRGSLEPLDFRAHADVYNGQSWANDYWYEYLSIPSQWYPYTYWRMRPTSGKYFTIDSKGIRKTWNPDRSGKPINIFMFGGSTMWGMGARDDETIPSYLSRMLSEKTNVPFKITNFAQPAYVNTQELITYLMELQHENVPDIVVFYDGVNDVFAALQSQKAGLPQNEANRVQEFNILHRVRKNDLAKAFLIGCVNNSNFKHILNSLVLAHMKRKAPNDVHGTTDQLAKEIVQVYTSNISIEENVSEKYGADALFYWQPIIFTKQHLTPYEKLRADDEAWQRSGFLTAEQEMDRSTSLASNPKFRNLAHVLDNEEQPLYVDYSHLGETGNQIIAEKMLPDVLKLVQKRTSKLDTNHSNT